MKSHLIRLASTVFALAAVVFAQSPGGFGGGAAGGPNGNAPRTGSGLDMTTLQVIEGKITAIQIGVAAQYPTIVINGKQIRVAPVWFMLDNDFQLATGDVVTVKAAASTIAGNSYLYAVEIARAGVVLTLRDSTGIPLWTGGSNGRDGRNGNTSAPRTGAGCVAPETIRTVAGVVSSLTAGVGIQHPGMNLKLDDGSLLTLTLGPERILLGADLELEAGAKVTVKYGVAACTEENLVLEITDANGATLKLREDDGRPAWN
ncbi:MAG: hypothetical protein KatS3mg005_2084 [Bryobacteraceae bacterium]|nr:MAG: hypothetical protein KatS3mg005_2084 [Bryobacteraceae bacterium]